VYGRGGVDHGLHFAAPDDAALVVLVREHESLAAALRHARHPRARPAHQRHVRVRGQRLVIDGGRGRAGRGRRGRRRAGSGRLIVRTPVAVHRDAVHQRHAVDAVLGAGERQPPVNAGRPGFLSEHDQLPVVQHRHVVVDDGHLPGAHVARHAAVHVKHPAVRIELLRQVRRLQELHVRRYPPAQKSDVNFRFSRLCTSNNMTLNCQTNPNRV
jgi:hypothetical protein